jgi:hypothetical protein
MSTRGNCIGLLIGHLQGHDERVEDGVALSPEDGALLNRMVIDLRARGLRQPNLLKAARKALSARAVDEQIVSWVTESFLARAPMGSTLESLTEELAASRQRSGIEGPLLASSQANEILCHLAYILLRMPIAQLG